MVSMILREGVKDLDYLRRNCRLSSCDSFNRHSLLSGQMCLNNLGEARKRVSMVSMILKEGVKDLDRFRQSCRLSSCGFFNGQLPPGVSITP